MDSVLEKQVSGMHLCWLTESVLKHKQIAAQLVAGLKKIRNRTMHVTYLVLALTVVYVSKLSSSWSGMHPNVLHAAPLTTANVRGEGHC